ncbi:hypothetical protein B0O99DRAFT_269618 [Bisporella sp. PMI_857]|nr:hypothetical protein B0O99DRAFT_269618 [Bisporella sp. PMI_857]
MDLQCKKCGFKFTQKSSVIRHSKRCMQPRSHSIRQKSCRECSTAKTRCDLKRPICTRCALRKTSCNYTTSAEPPRSGDVTDCNEILPEATQFGATSVEMQHQSADPLPNTIHFNTPNSLSPGISTIFLPAKEALHNPTRSLPRDAASSGTDPAMSILIGTDENNTALSLLPSPATTPILVRHSMEFILRMLRTWPRMMAKEIQLPPIIHSSQIPETSRVKEKATPLSNCFTLAKMWHGQCPGARELVQLTVEREMQDLIDTHQTMDQAGLVASLQALSIYTIILLFPSGDQTSLPLLETDMFRQIRQIIYHTASSGLILPEENLHVRPSFQDWVQMETKRRAILTLYLLHWSYSIYHCLSSFDCRDLGFMPAPAAKYLWQETDHVKWEGIYNKFLAQWNGNDFYQWEFFEIEAGVRMNFRAETWLEDADEFGILFISIANAYEREPEFETIHL